MKKCIPLIFLLTACRPSPVEVVMTASNSRTTALLQAISFVDENTAWVSGHEATFCRTLDGGSTWNVFRYEQADSLQFRDIHAFSADKVILMSAGSGNLSRIISYSADEGFHEHFIMPDSNGFLNSIDFWNEQDGIAYGDAIDNLPYILLTHDGGKTWHRASHPDMPKAGQGEGGFAASGTCVVAGKSGKAWIATGAGGNARFLVTSDYGKSWVAYPSPLVKGEAAGNTSISMADGQTGFVVGGDLLQPEAFTNNAAFTHDGGQTWSLTERPTIPGAFYGGAVCRFREQYIAMAVGPQGINYTPDEGKSWIKLDTLNYWAVSLHPSGLGFATGTDGKILKLELR